MEMNWIHKKEAQFVSWWWYTKYECLLSDRYQMNVVRVRTKYTKKKKKLKTNVEDAVKCQIYHVQQFYFFRILMMINS